MERIQAIFQGDRLIQDFGMTLVEAREGYAKVSVVVAERFLNAHRIGHGVLLFAAADAAFALAVNAARDAVGVQWSLQRFPGGPARRDRDRRGPGHSRGPPIPGLRARRDDQRRPGPRQGPSHGPPRRPRSPGAARDQRARHRDVEAVGHPAEGVGVGNAALRDHCQREVFEGTVIFEGENGRIS